MAASNTEADQAWGMLADVEEEERRTKMLQRYTELAAMLEEERVSQMLMMARSEYDLPDGKLRSFTASRLCVWLMLDPEATRKLAASYNAAMSRIPGLPTTRRMKLARTVFKEFTAEEQDQLLVLIPEVFGGLRPEPAKKGWWPFGKR